MGETIRFGVSMDSALVELLDRMCRENGDPNRSETLRRLVRQEVIDSSYSRGEQEVIGTLTFIYPVGTHLPRVPIAPFPSLRITANLQLHADREICVKVLVVQGKGKEVNSWARQLLSSRKIIGKLNISVTEELKKEFVKTK